MLYLSLYLSLLLEEVVTCQASQVLVDIGELADIPDDITHMIT